MLFLFSLHKRKLRGIIHNTTQIEYIPYDRICTSPLLQSIEMYIVLPLIHTRCDRVCLFCYTPQVSEAVREQSSGELSEH